jgi:hypothetical protein
MKRSRFGMREACSPGSQFEVARPEIPGISVGAYGIRPFWMPVFTGMTTKRRMTYSTH